MEEDTAGQEGCGSGGNEEGEGCTGSCREERGHERPRSGASSLRSHIYIRLLTYPQFTYNPEWFADEEEDEEDEWDIEKYRRERQEEQDAAEADRIAALSLADANADEGYRETDAVQDGDGGS